MTDETLHATLEIVNKLGLHARAAVLLVQASGRYDAKVTVSKDGQEVDGRSIMGVMMLAAGKGASISIEALGDDADAALAALLKLFADKFDEGE